MLGVILLVQALTVAVSGSPTSMAYLPLRVAEAEGYFTREGLAVTLRSTRGEPEAAAALFDGTVDLAATSLETVARRAPPEVAPRLRLLVGLTAAPPVALLGTTAGADPPRVLASLARRLVGIGAPGADETWLAAILARARLSPRTVRITSLGTLELLRALESGEVAAGYVEAPYAAQLLATGRATLLADLRSAAAAAETLDAATVHAAVFGRVDRLPAPEALSAFTRALVAAEGRIVGADAADLATRLAPAASARPDEFAARLAASRGLFLPDPSVSAAQARASFGLIRERMPLPPFGHLPSPRELVELPRR
jgi:ABC-type nitrate/sulfonate/bicarbonate transport system substrate-binding protein